MARLCTVCTNAGRDQVDAELRAGLAIATVKKMHPELSESALTRHKARHLKKVARQRRGMAEALLPRPAPTATVAKGEPPRRASSDEASVILEAIARLELVAGAEGTTAKDKIAANTSIGRLAELHAKITGKLGPAAVFTGGGRRTEEPEPKPAGEAKPPWRVVKGGKAT